MFRSTSLNIIRKRNFLRYQSNQTLDAYRTNVASWLKIGRFDSGDELLVHLSNQDLLRALLVLQVCSYDSFIRRQEKIFDIYQSFGGIGKGVLQKTFFKQFVGGDNELDMMQTVNSIQQRRMRLMLLPVVEGDLSGKNAQGFLDSNLQEITSLMNLACKLQPKSPLLQLKLSGIIPGTVLESVSKDISKYAVTSSKSYAHIHTKIVEEFANMLSGKHNMPTFLNLNPSETSEFVAVQHSEKPGILVDAEFFACKPAIATLALAMMVINNTKDADSLIGTTIQAYLKEAVTDVSSEIEIVRKFGVKWFGKVVRGAYMNWERSFALTRGELSPICETYEETNQSYDRILDKLLQNIAENGNSCLVVATHNERSIRHTAQLMKDLKIEKQSGHVHFAQIYGMAEWLSAPLVTENYSVYKSVPYGKLKKVLPYLGRRATENVSVLQGTREERKMLIQELKRRMGF